MEEYSEGDTNMNKVELEDAIKFLSYVRDNFIGPNNTRVMNNYETAIKCMEEKLAYGSEEVHKEGY